MRPVMAIVLLSVVGCGNKQAPEPAASTTTSPEATVATSPATDTTSGKPTSGKPAPFVKPQSLRCDAPANLEPVRGPDCVTKEIKCGETVVGHTKGGVNLYDTEFYEHNFCWPGTRNHNGGDERVYLFVPDKSDGAKAGATRQRMTVTFDTPCADLSFTNMRGALGACPTQSRRFCDTPNPFTRKQGRTVYNFIADPGEVFYFMVEGADDEEGPFSIKLECAH